jgi:DNA-binding CsgD family transcriptional regulator
MNYARPGRRPIALGDPLSEREIEILILTGRGMSVKQISFKLGIRDHTVVAHLDTARKKLGALNKTHAMVLAIATKIVRVKDFKDANT